MTFDDAIATQPAWVQYWVRWMAVAITASVVVLLFSKATRRDALVILATNIGVYFVMMWLFEKIGFVRLLGIVHVGFWTPLAVYLYWRLKDQTIVTPFRQVIWLFLATIVVSLAFDYADVARYILGERSSMAN